MKKTRKKVVLIIFSVLVVMAGVAFLNFSPLLFMKPVESGEIFDTGIYAVKNNINSLFFIKSDNGYIVVDAGSDVEAVKSGMAQASIDVSDVKYVLLTHSDYDHVASLAIFSNAEILMSADEVQMIDGSTKRNAFSSNTLPDGVISDQITLLSDGRELNLGGHTIQCVKAPGHTLGSMAFLVDGNYLFTGDAFKVSNNVMMVHPYTMDGKAAKDSILRLDDVRASSEYVFTAHYGYYEANQLKAQ